MLEHQNSPPIDHNLQNATSNTPQQLLSSPIKIN